MIATYPTPVTKGEYIIQAEDMPAHMLAHTDNLEALVATAAQYGAKVGKSVTSAS